MKRFVLVACLSILGFVLVGCNSDENLTTNINAQTTENIILEIISQVWCSRSLLHGNEFEPQSEMTEVYEGQLINLNGLVVDELAGSARIEMIGDDYVTVSFNSNHIVPVNENGTISLLSERGNWTAQINFNEEYRVATQTMSAGVNWVFIFNR